MAGNFFRGTTAAQDSRWGNSDARLLKQLKTAPILAEKVDLNKVNLDVMARWVTEKVTELLGFEDEIVIGTIINNLQSKEVNPKRLQLDITGFLESSAAAFMEELWTLLVDAQHNPSGIPTAFLEKKKQELMARQTNNVPLPTQPLRPTVRQEENGTVAEAKQMDIAESKSLEQHDDRRGSRRDDRREDRRRDKSRERRDDRRRHRSRDRSRDRSRERRRDNRRRDRSRSGDRRSRRDSRDSRDRARDRDREKDRDRRRHSRRSHDSSPSVSDDEGRREERRRRVEERRKERAKASSGQDNSSPKRSRSHSSNSSAEGDKK